MATFDQKVDIFFKQLLDLPEDRIGPTATASQLSAAARERAFRRELATTRSGTTRSAFLSAKIAEIDSAKRAGTLGGDSRASRQRATAARHRAIAERGRARIASFGTRRTSKKFTSSSSTSRSSSRRPTVTTRTTSEGIEVSINSSDAVLRELALQKEQKKAELAQEKELRKARRESATLSAGLQRKALAIEVEQRGQNVGRELSKLRRGGRIARADVLSRASGAGASRSSAFKASRIAIQSANKGQTGRIKSDEARNIRGDALKGQSIEANLQARLAENQDPVNIFLSESSASAGSTSIIRNTLTRN